MIRRNLFALTQSRLRELPAVALLRPRQMGKTTLARLLDGGQRADYLDLESPVDFDSVKPWLSSIKCAGVAAESPDAGTGCRTPQAPSSSMDGDHRRRA